MENVSFDKTVDCKGKVKINMGKFKHTEKLFCSKKRKAWHKGRTNRFDTNQKDILAHSDKGSWYNQDQRWLDEEDNETNEINASRRKIILPEEDIDFEIDDGYSDSDDSSLESENEADTNENTTDFGRYLIIDLSTLQRELRKSLCCSACNSTVSLCEKTSCCQGLGTKLSFICDKNDH